MILHFVTGPITRLDVQLGFLKHFGMGIEIANAKLLK
jgi:hypothetical protein